MLCITWWSIHSDVILNNKIAQLHSVLCYTLYLTLVPWVRWFNWNPFHYAQLPPANTRSPWVVFLTPMSRQNLPDIMVYLLVFSICVLFSPSFLLKINVFFFSYHIVWAWSLLSQLFQMPNHQILYSLSFSLHPL